jgi:hypothetical protein
VAAAAWLPGCLLGFDAAGKDRCEVDEDCLGERRCLRLDEAEGLGFCEVPDDEGLLPGCDAYDQDGDGAFTRAACGPTDCDDEDARRAPGLEEGCDGLDNDCDGQTDEGLRNVCGGCGPVPPEVCDGLDNDCDGTLDDGVRNACGGCGEVLAEVCDGLDNDCDGQTDEGTGEDCACDPAVTQARACPTTLRDRAGVCEEGTQRCVDGAWGPCEGLTRASPEVCDGLDNDCDGGSDEGFDLNTNLSHCGACGAGCQGPYGSGSCEAGRCRMRCAAGWVDANEDGHDGCEYACVASSSLEGCDDGDDDNCDGRVDEACARVVLGGRWWFVNLFGRKTEAQTPALVVGELWVDDPAAGRARLTRLTRHASNLPSGMLEITQDSPRQIRLGADGTLALEALQDNDPSGRTFWGVLAQGRALAVLLEQGADGGPIASVAFLMRQPPADAVVGHEQVRGGYGALGVFPERLLGPTPEEAVELRAWSLDAAAPVGAGAELWSQRATPDRLVYPDDRRPTLTYRAVQGGQLELARRQDAQEQRALAWVDDAGGVGVMVQAASPGAESLEAGVSFLVERRPVALSSLEGAWALAGLQTKLADDGGSLRYNALSVELRAVPSPEDPARLDLAVEEEQGWRVVGSARALGVDAQGASLGLELELEVDDSFGPSPLRLRGHATANGAALVLWELDEAPRDAPRPSVMVAVRRPTGAAP